MLCYALGWQGGTIHQVSEETGLRTSEILGMNDAIPDTSKGADFWEGWLRVQAYRDCRGLDLTQYKGNLQFWLGAADAMILQKYIL